MFVERFRPFILLIGCSAVLILAGCGAMLPKQDRLLAAARYGELRQHMEQKIGDIKKADNYDVYCLCLSYSKVKRYNKLRSCLDEMQIRVDRGDTDIVQLGMTTENMTVLTNYLRAQMLLELGNYPKAIKSAYKAYHYAKNSDFNAKEWRFIETCTLLGLCHALNGEKQEAEKYLHELENRPDVFGLKNIKSMSLARMHMALGNYDQALHALQGSDDFELWFTSAVSAAVLQVGDIWSHVQLPQDYMYNKLLLETGDVAEAKKGFDELLGISRVSENGEIYWMILFDRGVIAEKEGNIGDAIEFYRRSIEAIEAQRSTIHTEVSKIGFIGDKQTVYDRLISLLFDRAMVADAFEYVERAKARALIDMLASRNHSGNPVDGRHEKEDLLAEMDAAESETILQDETIPAERYAKQRAIAVKLKDEVRALDPELASLVTVTSPDLTDIQQLLPNDETLIEYYGSGDQWFAFVANRHQVRGIRLKAGDLKRDVASFRQQIMARGSNAFKAEGKSLYDRLIQPLKEVMTSNLTIVPHGPLHYLPFGALWSGDEFLIDRYRIRILPSASVLSFLKDRSHGHIGNLLAFGNPDLGDPENDLPGAQSEAIAIAKEMPNSRLFLRKKATETIVKKYGEDFRYVHFATHGVFDPAHPLRSGLLLSSDDENDGKLTVMELYDMDLPADLVTLSACNTGLGKVSSGDDVVGFIRGFLYAGASSIVSSLWQVDDQATAILMQSFYDSLPHMDKREALRTAQMKVKNAYNPHPYYWAAFQLTGSIK